MSYRSSSIVSLNELNILQVEFWENYICLCVNYTQDKNMCCPFNAYASNNLYHWLECKTQNKKKLYVQSQNKNKHVQIDRP
jgi:hypothetical protein